MYGKRGEFWIKDIGKMGKCVNGYKQEGGRKEEEEKEEVRKDAKKENRKGRESEGRTWGKDEG